MNARQAAAEGAMEGGRKGGGPAQSCNIIIYFAEPEHVVDDKQVKRQLKGVRGKAAAKEADRRTRRLALREERLQQKLEAAREALDEQLSNGWRTFEGLRDVLVQAGVCSWPASDFHL